MKLYGKDEFYPKLNNKTFNILKVDDLQKEKIMINIINKFLNNKNDKYLGIDFEFNQVTKNFKDVALMQINLENSEKGDIFIFKPSELNSLNIIIKLLTDINITKILHGSESLDIPYLFNQLLITKENVDKFCKNFYDTKFLCEYYNISNNKSESCGIYNLLCNHKIITKKQVEYLENIEKKMGNIQYIQIDIYKMSDSLLKYALYDVIYLPELLKELLNFSKNNLYYDAISDITSIIFKSKRNIETIFNELEDEINKQNNYFVIENNTKNSLHYIYEIFLYQYFTFNDLIEINYFKKFFTIIIKLCIYSTLYKYKDIYITTNNKLKNMNYDYYYDWIKSYDKLNIIYLSICNNFDNLFKHLLL